MKAGFSFCGVDISELGLSYAPEIQDTYVYKPAGINLHEQTFEGHDGGYLYGVSKQPKEIYLRCIFEEKQIDKGIMSQIFNLFSAGRSGRLVFSRRPWCYYNATVSGDVDISGLTNYLNGAIVIPMKIYYPFARSDFYYRERKEQYFENMIVNSAVPFLKEMVPNFDFEENAAILATPDNPMTQQTSFILHNPGTERAAVGIQIAGYSGAGVVIHNSTTNQEAKFVAMGEAALDGVSSWVYSDGINGKTTVHKNNSDEINFLYHNKGFIQLEPAYPATRNLYAVYSEGYSVDIKNILYKNYVGQYICLTDGWHKIVQQPDKHTFIVQSPISGSGSIWTMVSSMNEITVTPVDTMRLTRLRFLYKPTYS